MDGFMNGKGILNSLDGDMYEGEFKNGLENGQGILINLEGDIYEGEFMDGFMNGQGKFINANGDSYEGEFKKNKVFSPPKHRKNQTVLLINKDEGVRELKSLKRRYKKVVLLEESSVMNANFLKQLVTYGAKEDKDKKKLKIVINEHGGETGELGNQDFVLESLNKVLEETEEYNKENIEKPIKNINIVLDTCYGSSIVYNNKKFQEVLKSFIKEGITVGVSAGDEKFESSNVLMNNKNSLPLAKTNGYYVIYEFRFDKKN